MKRFIGILCGVLCCALYPLSAAAQDEDTHDSLRVSLITCGPGDEVWSLYGHTAIRVEDAAHGHDLMVNYGIFSFHQPHFVRRFVFGKTDYEMGIAPTAYFIGEYLQEGRWIKQQELALTAEEKERLHRALEENYLPENRTYRYNFFYDNCTTRARDMIEKCADGKIKYPDKSDIGTMTCRKGTHEWNENHRWARFGNDLLLGIGADKSVSAREMQFLPVTLSDDFNDAVISCDSAVGRKLVKETLWLVSPEEAKAVKASSEAPAGIGRKIFRTVTPVHCFLLLLAITLFIEIIEHFRKIYLWGFDLLLLLATGLAGWVLTAMIFSSHPTVSLNLQILVLNPLSLIFAVPVVLRIRKRLCHPWQYVLSACVILFFIGAVFQDYAEGIWILALILLVRMRKNSLPVFRHS